MRVFGGELVMTERSKKSRRGSKRRREAEFKIVQWQCQNNPRFAARLQGRLKRVNGCVLYDASLTSSGYARVTVWDAAKKKTDMIHAHRLFLILKLGRPIKLGYDSGHHPLCGHRNCVLHIEEQHYSENALTDPNGENFNVNDIPF